MNRSLVVMVVVAVALAGELSAQQVASAAQVQRADSSRSGAPAAEAQAVREPLVTDRPDFTESTAAMGRGEVQLESGYTLDQVGEERSQSFGELLLRVGVGHRLELRLGFNSYAVSTAPDVAEVSGLEDTSLGFKLNLSEGSAEPGLGLPSAAIIVATSLPTGADPYRGSRLQPEVKFGVGWDLTERVAFSSNWNYAYLADLAGDYGEFSVSGSFGFGLTDRMGAYTEYYSFHPAGVREAAHYANGGLTFQLTPDFQLDARLGRGFNGADRDRFFGIGLARRW